MIQIGDRIILKDPLWYNGENIGGRKGEVVSITGYILVNIEDYHSNPVKCFRNEVSVLVNEKPCNDFLGCEDGDMFSGLFDDLLDQ